MADIGEEPTLFLNTVILFEVVASLQGPMDPRQGQSALP